MAYAIYLRKSRVDIEAESHGMGDTLARHEAALTELAGRDGYEIAKIYREVVSGDTIAARPQMQEMLQAIEDGMYDGILVMEVERLARGDTIDQGIVSRTFQVTGTKIITPLKVYDPDNEYDEEYFEFGLFMARREYKTIVRRMQRGTAASIAEGKWAKSTPPYGYRSAKLKNAKGYILDPDPEEADVVKKIFDLFARGENGKTYGVTMIANQLDDMGVKPRHSKRWSSATIRGILDNPVYIGKLRYDHRNAKKSIRDGKLVITRKPRSADYKLVNGLHSPIIDEGTFEAAQKKIQSSKRAPVKRDATLKNPLAGLVICSECGAKMIRRPYAGGCRDELICGTHGCKNVASPLEMVEQRVLSALDEWLDGYNVTISRRDKYDPDIRAAAIAKVHDDIERVSKQIDTAHDLLEQGIYTPAVFIARTKKLSEELDDLKKHEDKITKEAAEEQRIADSLANIGPQVRRVIDIYWSLPTVQQKNDMLKTVLSMAVYKKEHSARWHWPLDDFEVTIYPKAPDI